MLAAPSPNPGLTPSPTPSELHVNGLAKVTVKQLRQMVDPANPKNHSFEEPGQSYERMLLPLHRDDEIYLVDGPLKVDGREFWKVAETEYFVGCCAPFGWIPTTNSDGIATVEPVMPECGDASQDFVALSPPANGSLSVLACYGGMELHVRGPLICSRPTVDSAYEIDGPWKSQTLCDVGDRMSVYGEAVTSLVEDPNYGDWYADFVRLTGHFDDPASSECNWTYGTYMNIVPDTGGPAETAEFACRTLFIVTHVESI
jgi:hypothetical protein